MSKEEMIKLLNEDLTKEYSAAVQYVQHAAKIKEAQFQSIQKEMVVHANEEIGHAVEIAEQIALLGGDPTIDVAERHVSDDSVEMLNQDLEGELDAVARYKARVAQADELDEHDLKKILEGILAVEEEHAQDLQEALGQ